MIITDRGYFVWYIGEGKYIIAGYLSNGMFLKTRSTLGFGMQMVRC